MFRFAIRLLFVLPIKKNKILFSAQKGNSYSCNPRILFEYLYKRSGENIRFVWLLNNRSNDLDVFLKDDKRIAIVKYNSIAHFFHHLTSHVLISNIHNPIYLPRRSQQLSINTWHGGGAYKRIGLAVPLSDALAKSSGFFKTPESFDNRAWEVYKAKYNTKDITHFVSSSTAFTEAMFQSHLLPRSAFLEIGMPRNDIFFSEDFVLREKVRKKLNLSPQTKVLLFAPTYRGNAKDPGEDFELDVLGVFQALAKKWPGEWRVMFRKHLWDSAKLNTSVDILDVSQYEEMQELLLVADVLITDYSSSIWDFSLTKKPGFLFVPDLDYYTHQDRGFYTQIENWPYPYAQTNAELIDLIRNFDEQTHRQRVAQHLAELGSFERGTATAVLATRVLAHVFPGEEPVGKDKRNGFTKPLRP